MQDQPGRGGHATSCGGAAPVVRVRGDGAAAGPLRRNASVGQTVIRVVSREHQCIAVTADIHRRLIVSMTDLRDRRLAHHEGRNHVEEDELILEETRNDDSNDIMNLTPPTPVLVLHLGITHFLGSFTASSGYAPLEFPRLGASSVLEGFSLRPLPSFFPWPHGLLLAGRLGLGIPPSQCPCRRLALHRLN